MFLNKINKLTQRIEKIKDDINIPIISDFLDWFYDLFKINFLDNTPNLKLNKWDIYFIELWRNIWNELNKARPCIIYSNYYNNNWNTVVIVPLKSYKSKINKNINILLKKDECNWLEKISIIDISSIRQISKKRILFKIWILDKRYMKKLDKKILRYFWIKTNSR